MAKKKRANRLFIILGKILLFIIKIPYYIGKGIIFLVKGARTKIEKSKINKKRISMRANYQEFETIKSEKGDFENWEKTIMAAESKIGIIVGARGSGKTAFGLAFLENLYAKHKKKIYAMGFKKEEMPSWIETVENISQIKNNSFVLIDEGGILFSSRRAMSSANELLSELILISRHKNINVLFISQNSSNLDVNIVRQADYLVFKKPSLLQSNFERRVVKEIYKEIAEGFDRYKSHIGLAYIYSDNFKGFVANPLPSFWSMKISKSFR